MKQLCMIGSLVRLSLMACLFHSRSSWAADNEAEDESKKHEASASSAPAKDNDANVLPPKVPSKPVSVASKFRRVVKRVVQKQKGKGTKNEKPSGVVSEDATSAPASSAPVATGSNAGKKESTVTRTVGATAGSVALLFFTGAALKRHILGEKSVPDLEQHLPGALTDGSILLADSPDPYENVEAFSYSNQQSPRTILTQVAFPGDEGFSPMKPSAPVLLDGKGGSSPRWMSAGVAALLALFSVAGVFWANREIKRGGLLSGGLAAWDVDNCIMFVDVEGAHRFMRLEGEFIRMSARIYLDASQTTGLLRYMEKPRHLNNVVSRIIRRTLTRTELFPVPRDKCFAALTIVSPSLKESTTDRHIAADGPEKAGGKEEKRALIKSAFIREIINPKTGTTAGILVHLERCPGWRRARQQTYVPMNPVDFLGTLKPSEGLGGCPRIEHRQGGIESNLKTDTTTVKGNWTFAPDVVGTPFVDSIKSDTRFQVLACNMQVTLKGTLRLYLLVAASTGTGVKVHYALGSKQLLISSRGPSPTDSAPCLTNAESSGLVFEENVPVYTSFSIKHLFSALERVPRGNEDRVLAGLRDLVLPFKTRISGVVVEIRQEGLDVIPKKVPLRKADEVALRRGPEVS